MSIKYTILGLLNYSDMHGYRIKEHIEKNFDHMWSVNFGQIYPNLKDLEEEGFIHKSIVAPWWGYLSSYKKKEVVYVERFVPCICGIKKR